MAEQDNTQTMLEALGEKVAALEERLDALEEAKTAAAEQTPKKVEKPKIPEAPFKVDGKEYNFRFPKFRADLGDGSKIYLAQDLKAPQKKVLVEKYPGLVEAV